MNQKTHKVLPGFTKNTLESAQKHGMTVRSLSHEQAPAQVLCPSMKSLYLTLSNKYQYAGTDPAVAHPADSASTGTSTQENCGSYGSGRSDNFGLRSQFMRSSFLNNATMHNKIVGGQGTTANEICWQVSRLPQAAAWAC